MGKTYKHEKQPKPRKLKEKTQKIKNFKHYIEEMLEDDIPIQPLNKKK